MGAQREYEVVLTPEEDGGYSVAPGRLEPMGSADVLSPHNTWPVNIDRQIAAVTAVQGTLAIQPQLLGEAFSGPPAPTSTPGVNATKRLALASGQVVFHKPFSGVKSPVPGDWACSRSASGYPAA
jgi:hypothetical protein